jgi:Golgi SNAP receptor complex protein 2
MLSELLPEEKRRIFELEQQLMEVECKSGRVQSSDVYLGLREMTSRLDGLDKLANKEGKTRRDDMKRRIAHLRCSHGHIKTSLDSICRRRGEASYEENNRALLFDSGGLENGSGNGAYDLEGGIREGTSLDSSSSMVNSYINLARDTLSELTDQRDRFKGIQRKVLDVFAMLGISNKIIKKVEGRDAVDKWIVYGGMLLITALIVYIYLYIRK